MAFKHLSSASRAINHPVSSTIHQAPTKYGTRDYCLKGTAVKRSVGEQDRPISHMLVRDSPFSTAQTLFAARCVRLLARAAPKHACAADQLVGHDDRRCEQHPLNGVHARESKRSSAHAALLPCHRNRAAVTIAPQSSSLPLRLRVASRGFSPTQCM